MKGFSGKKDSGGKYYENSTQAWLPIETITNGIVVLKDGRFIKVLEVLPVNFYLKSESYWRRKKMKAIFVTGGKQYMVEEGQELYVEKLNNEVDSEVVFDEVLYVDGKVGTPTVKGAKVVAKVLKHGKQKKVLVFKYKAKKKYRRTQGHRQPYTKIVIKSISK